MDADSELDHGCENGQCESNKHGMCTEKMELHLGKMINRDGGTQARSAYTLNNRCEPNATEHQISNLKHAQVLVSAGIHVHVARAFAGYLRPFSRKFGGDWRAFAGICS